MSLIKSIYYTVLDTVTAGKGVKRTVNGFEVNFPVRYFKYYESNYEAESFAFLRKTIKKGDVILDIGGHIGLYAAVFGKLTGPGGKVLSFEPTPSTNAVLRKTVELNGLQSIVEVRNEAISKEKGETFFYISDNQTDNSNSLVDYEKPINTKGIRVPLISVDEIGATLSRIDFIKIDVEGVEYDALLGARSVLTGRRPVCILALHPRQIKSNGNSLEQIWDVVKSYNYNLVFNGAPISREEFCRHTNLFDVHLIPA